LIVVDTSALVAIALREPERSAFLDIMEGEPDLAISAVNFVELTAVIAGRREDALPSDATDLLASLGITVFPINADATSLAVEVFIAFGKGRHPARLNLGDGFSYALAKSLDAPLLYKRDDFSRTDILPAYPG
jgi:ribonuclease VapC